MEPAQEARKQELVEFLKGRKLDESFAEVLTMLDWVIPEGPIDCPAFLTPAFIEKYLPELVWFDDLKDRLIAVANVLASDPVCCSMMTAVYVGLYIDRKSVPWNLIQPQKFFGDDAGLPVLLLAMASIPLIHQRYASFGIPEEYAIRHSEWIGGAAKIYQAAHEGKPGFTSSQIFWLALGAAGKITRVGRFEFAIDDFSDWWIPAIYVNNATGEKVAFARDGWKFNAVGDRLPNEATDGIEFTTTLVETETTVTGFAFNPIDSSISRELMTINKADWTLVAKTGDKVLGLHIPGGRPMDFEEAKRTLPLALDFFKKYRGVDAKLITCESWILNEQWLDRLSPESNLVKFMKYGRLFKFPLFNPQEGIFFVFGHDKIDPATHKADNKLQQMMIDMLNEGVPVKAGGIYFTVDMVR